MLLLVNGGAGLLVAFLLFYGVAVLLSRNKGVLFKSFLYILNIDIIF